MDIILHLGGNIDRIYKTIDVAKQHSEAIIIVSSEGGMQEMIRRFKNAGISKDRVIFDTSALDTPGNFCCTFNLVKRYNPKNLYFVTDRFHIDRSNYIATIAYMNTGITVIPCSYNGGDLNYVEPPSYALGNVIATLIWKYTGYLWVNGNIKNARLSYQKQAELELKSLVW
jgi:uncharacterized SAM-binding protein YcdF (DUF218 family)